MSRPSETITAIVGSIVGAVLILIGGLTDIEVEPAVAGAIVTLVSWITVGVTWFVSRRQRAGELSARKDGTVIDVPS